MRLVLLILASSICFCIGEPTFSADNSFDYKLITTVLQDAKDNVVISSLSIKLLLAILRHTIKGPAEDEIKNMLLPDIQERYLAPYFANILEKLQLKTQAYGLGMIQEIFINMEYVTVKRKSFEKACEHYYGTNILKANFSEANISANNINRYFALCSKGQITKVVTPDQLQGSAMLMINALYFKGIWKYAFNKLKSGKFDFLKYGTETVQTNFMVHTDTFKTGEFEKFSVLDLPYNDGNISMIIVLPHEGFELNEVLNPVTLKSIIEGEINLIEKAIEVMIPKFELKTKIKLPDILRKMGINTLFNGGNEIYEFSPKGLTISDVIHEAKIAVDEEGTKVSALSTVKIIPVFGTFKSTFNVNRPFVYLVIEKSTKTVLFSGKVVNPL